MTKKKRTFVALSSYLLESLSLESSPPSFCSVRALCYGSVVVVMWLGIILSSALVSFFVFSIANRLNDRLFVKQKLSVQFDFERLIGAHILLHWTTKILLPTFVLDLLVRIDVAKMTSCAGLKELVAWLVQFDCLINESNRRLLSFRMNERFVFRHHHSLSMFVVISIVFFFLRCTRPPWQLHQQWELLDERLFLWGESGRSLKSCSPFFRPPCARRAVISLCDRREAKWFLYAHD